MSQTIEVYRGELDTLVLQGAVVVDVRELGETNEAGLEIDSHVQLPLSRLSELPDRLDGTRPMIFYCRSGVRSFQAAELAARWTKRTAYYLSGGLLGSKLDA